MINMIIVTCFDYSFGNYAILRINIFQIKSEKNITISFNKHAGYMNNGLSNTFSYWYQHIYLFTILDYINYTLQFGFSQ